MDKKDKQDYWHLRKLLQQFEKIDKELFNRIQTPDWIESIQETVEAKREIKRFLADRPIKGVKSALDS